MAVGLVDKSAEQGKKASDVLKSLVKKTGDGAKQGAKQSISQTDDVLKKLPLENHHVLTDKNKTWTPLFDKITKNYKLDLNGSWNKVKIPHKGRHATEYHKWAYEQLQRIDATAKGNARVFNDMFGKLSRFVNDNPGMLRKSWWK